MAHLVFVYGTLRKGFGNHRYIEDAICLGKARTKEKYALYVTGIPYVYKDQKISQIIGEVYRVNDEKLRQLDRLEEYYDDENYWYKREMTDVILDSGEEICVFIYFFPEIKGVLIVSGDYADSKVHPNGCRGIFRI